jgi:rfaE bifunctional protein nucleotidyltransferase chain/domain
MTITGGIFGWESKFEERFVPDYERLAELVGYWKVMGLRIVLTSGSFDLIHGGHAAYLEAAKQLGDLLVVGVDSDDKVRARKGPRRPVVPEEERLRMLTYIKGVDIVTLKPADDARWKLISTVQPHTLVLSEDHKYEEAELAELKNKFCQEIHIMPRMGETTTSARVRLLQIDLAGQLSKGLAKALPGLIDRQIKEILGDD